MVLKGGKIPIKIWNSNSLDVDENPTETIVDVLGYYWDKIKDRIRMKPKSLNIQIKEDLTKRVLASVVAKQLWDPIGYTLPVSIKYRIDLQSIWQQGFTWDEPVGKEYKDIWEFNIQQMQKLAEFDIDRCLKPVNAIGLPQLHAVSDGGASAYGTCVFLRWVTTDGIVLVFVAAKGFAASLKYKTIPRIELMAVIAMCRLVLEIENALYYPIESRKFWIDSLVVLYWLHSLSSRFKPFVASNLSEELRYVPSKNNPADSLTKPITCE